MYIFVKRFWKVIQHILRVLLKKSRYLLNPLLMSTVRLRGFRSPKTTRYKKSLSILRIEGRFTLVLRLSLASKGKGQTPLKS